MVLVVGQPIQTLLEKRLFTIKHYRSFYFLQGAQLNTSTFNNFNDTNDEVICYVFADVDGYQKIGSYTGTGAAGNAVDVGFEPAFVMYKRSSGTGNWVIIDKERGAGTSGAYLNPNLSNAEGNYTIMDFTSNGFYITRHRRNNKRKW